MKAEEKIKLLQDKHFGEWLKIRHEVDEELSKNQSMFCVCGKLATGFHERSCRKFNGLVNKETLKRLKHLIVG